MKTKRRNDVLVRSIVKKLKQVRAERGLTQEVVFYDTNLFISRIETGKHSITITTLSDLCDYYGITLGEFFREIESH